MSEYIHSIVLPGTVQGEDLKQEMQLTLLNHLTLKCTGRARRAAVHVANPAAVIAYR